jgi:ParB-like chromosome segregation protein Spo0J
LRNRGLELNPKNQKQTTLYKNVLDSIKEKGLINPLTVVVDNNNRYKVCIGNNRYLACKELGIEEVNVVISESEEPEVLHKTYIYYKKVFKNDSPFINYERNDE